jgi:hypothetical protein
LTLGFFPLAFWVLFRVLEQQRVSDGVWLGVTSALLSMASFYYAAIWFLCLAVVVLVDAIRLRWPNRQWWKALGAAGGTCALLLGPIAYVYAEFQTRVPFTRESVGFGLNPIDLLTPAPSSVLYSGLFDWASVRQSGGLVEHGFFLGFIVLTLAAAGSITFLARKSRALRGQITSRRFELEIGYLVVAGLVCLLVAAGPEVRGIPMPFALLSRLPGYSSIRAVSRFALPTLLAGCVLAGWALERIVEKTRPTVRLLAVGLITAAILVELAVVPVRVPVPEPSSVRAVLESAPPGAVMELPMVPGTDPAFPFVEGPRMLASLGDWRPRFNGFSGGFPPGYLDDVLELSQFPDATSMARIEALGIRYLLLHGSGHPDSVAYSFEEIERVLSLVSDVTSVKGVGADWLIDLRPGSS